MAKTSSSSGAVEAAAATTTGAEKQQDAGGIQVICCGLGRTGTLSLTDALEILGYKPYHYMDFSHISDWADWAEGNNRSTDEISGFGITSMLIVCLCRRLCQCIS